MKKNLVSKLILAAILLIVLLLFVISLRLPQIPDDLNSIALSSPTRVYANDGQLVKVMANRLMVPLEDVSPHLIDATLALEDRNFYGHHGFSKKGFLRAIWLNLKSGELKRGGSTITQQLAKNLFFTFERSILRKIQELFITFQIEQQFSKDEILEAYVNQIDFGSGIYGIELAAQTYFSKHADELTLAEAAMLAGIPRWPPRYNPYSHEDIARERQSFVLQSMVDADYISQDQRQEALEEPLKYQQINELQGHADYFVNEAIKSASDEYGRNAVMYGGLDLYTTLDTKLQFSASQAVKEGLAELDNLLGLSMYEDALWEEKLDYPQAALVAIDPKSGAIKAMVGGRDYRRAPFNRAVSSNRSPGSSFKLFTYLAAFDRGEANPTTVMVDEPTQFKIYNQVWQPQNYDGTYRGSMILKMALAHSVNIIAAKTIERVGPEVVVEYAKDMGIRSELEPHLSLALGSMGVSPVDMAGAYATIANGGIYREPYMVKQVRAREEDVAEKSEPKSHRVVDSQISYVMIDMLRGVVELGTGKSVRDRGFYRPCGAKTGTTNDYRDAWFIGFTPELVTAVWVGFDDNRVMRTKWKSGVTGGVAAIPIWVGFMKRALENTPYSEFPIPPGIEFLKVDESTGNVVGAYEPGVPVAVRRGMRD